MPFCTTRRVEWRDTDAAGIVHFSAFFTYMEAAEHELLRHLGLSVSMYDDQGHISWPRVSVQCDYQNPARFEDLLQIDISIARLGTKSVTYDFLIHRDATPIAHGRMTAVCCRLRSGQPPQSIPIPAAFAAALSHLLSNAS